MRPTDFLWKSAPDGLKPGEGGAAMFCAPLDVSAKRLEELVQPLSDDERRRAERFHLERDQQRFLVGRGTLREILGTLLEADPAELGFDYGEFGKPHLAGPTAVRGLHFNVAHSDSIAVYAIADREIGVDVERIRPMDEVEHIASRIFGPRERKCWDSLPIERRLEAFFNCWTRKEAYLKAIGVGLCDWLEQIEVSLMPDEPARLLGVPAESPSTPGWLLQSLAPAADFIGAVALQPNDPRVNCWTWSR